jgi:hypothetical protein
MTHCDAFSGACEASAERVERFLASEISGLDGLRTRFRGGATRKIIRPHRVLWRVMLGPIRDTTIPKRYRKWPDDSSGLSYGIYCILQRIVWTRNVSVLPSLISFHRTARQCQTSRGRVFCRRAG